MAKIIESFEVDSPELGKSFKLDLVEDVDLAHLEFIEKHWKPILKKRREMALLEFFSLHETQQTQANWDDIETKFGAPDAHWEWHKKCGSSPGSGNRSFALLNGGDVEAVMMLTSGTKSRVDGGASIIYVDYVATAPWNRPLIQSPPRFRRLGVVLLGSAVATSMSAESEGRCGLHSLIQAEGLYRKLGMTDHGILRGSDLRYFEFDEAAAKRFHEEGDL